MYHVSCSKNKSWFPVHFALVAKQLCLWCELFAHPLGLNLWPNTIVWKASPSQRYTFVAVLCSYRTVWGVCSTVPAQYYAVQTMYQPNTMHCILCSTVPQPQRLIIVRALYRARQKAERALQRNKNIYLSVCFCKDDKEIYTNPAIYEKFLVTPKFKGW